jgi:hypothetical protein
MSHRRRDSRERRATIKLGLVAVAYVTVMAVCWWLWPLW